MADMIATRHEVTGHTAEFPEETIPAWRALGWIPLSEIPAETPAEDLAPTASEDAETSSAPTKPAARKRATETEE